MYFFRLDFITQIILIVELLSIAIYSGSKSFTSCIVCNYFLPVWSFLYSPITIYFEETFSILKSNLSASLLRIVFWCYI